MNTYIVEYTNDYGTLYKQIQKAETPTKAVSEVRRLHHHDRNKTDKVYVVKQIHIVETSRVNVKHVAEHFTFMEEAE